MIVNAYPNDGRRGSRSLPGSSFFTDPTRIARVFHKPWSLAARQSSTDLATSAASAPRATESGTRNTLPNSSTGSMRTAPVAYTGYDTSANRPATCKHSKPTRIMSARSGATNRSYRRCASSHQSPSNCCTHSPASSSHVRQAISRVPRIPPMKAPTDAGLSTDLRNNCLTGPTVEWSHACRSCSVSFGHGMVCWDTSKATVENTLTPAVNDAIPSISDTDGA